MRKNINHAIGETAQDMLNLGLGTSFTEKELNELGVKIPEIKNITPDQIKRIRTKNNEFKKKYGKSYEEFSENVPDTTQGHDDWIEWTYTDKIVNELSKKIEKLRVLIGK